MQYFSNKEKPQKQSLQLRSVEFAALILVSIVLIIGFLTLSTNQKEQFVEIEKKYKENQAINLDSEVSAKDLADLLKRGNYVATEQDAAFIAQHISDKLNSGIKLDNLGTLNKTTFNMPVSRIDSSCVELTERVNASRAVLQMPESIFLLEKLYVEHSKSIVNLGSGNQDISIVVNRENMPVANVLIQLTEHFALSIDSLNKNIEAVTDTVIAYAMTDEKGKAVFKSLNGDGYYSVLPIKKDCEYGASKGTTNGKSLEDSKGLYIFTEREHQIKPFSSFTYQELKKDEVLTVRTPQVYQDTFVGYIIWFFIAWLFLHIYFTVRKRNVDQLLLPLLMTLTGISVLIMYAIHNPLVDTMRGNEMVQGVFVGVMGIVITSEINFIKFFNDGYKFRINMPNYKRIIPKTVQQILNFLFPKKILNDGYKISFDVLSRINKIPKGIGFLLLALLLTALLWTPLGKEIGGMKVNLNFGFLFQPSEIAKYLMIVFFAAFFSRNTDGFVNSKQSRVREILLIFIGLVVLLGVYLVLGDMGPALVLALTFIIIYSMMRRDFVQMLIGVAIYAAFLWIGKIMNVSSFGYIAFSALWLLIWWLVGYIKKQFFESALFLNLVVATFVFGGSLLCEFDFLHSQGERLLDRTAMSGEGVWNNEIQGGDQVAQGMWALATGGFNGQGLGNGSPNMVPAFHTDMIFSTIGEELGWIGLFLIIICFAMLIHRTLLIGRRAAQPFVFYLAYGIAIVTAVQFLIITFGSIGIIPLTGITVPFLSYGRVSMILNLIAFGVVFSISKQKGADIQLKYITSKYDKKVTLPAIACFALLSLFLLGCMYKYQFIDRDKNLIKAAYITDQRGNRIVQYNPRIGALIREIRAGNIYDRNNLLLATNSKDLVFENFERFKDAGIDESIYKNTIKQIGRRRYYPFGDNLFFWIGNYNTRLLWEDGEDARGYIAERRHLSYLRGFSTQPDDAKKDITLDSHKYQRNRYIPTQQASFKRSLYDYSELIDFLKEGKNSNKVKKYNSKVNSRNLKLTVDAKLQTHLQNRLQEAFTKGSFNIPNSRTSVVVLNAGNGDLLCSANYPLPNQDELKAKLDNRNYKESSDYRSTTRDLGITYPTQPGSTAKIMSSLAGFNKIGDPVADKTYYIYPEEIIHTTGFPEPTRNVTHKQAIVESSNVYFIKLVNDLDLYNELTDIYCETGIRVGYNSPYIFHKSIDTCVIISQMREMQEKGTRKYQQYTASLNNGGTHKKLNDAEYQLAWGQDPITATPLAMARVVSSIVNNGSLMETRYVLSTEENSANIILSDNADVLKGYMIAETKNRRIKVPDGIGGKSGTPQRIVDGKMKQDAWYVFFVEKSPALNNAPLAIAVRIELGVGSGTAYRLAAEQIIPELSKLGYVSSE